ncbi:MAG TPA: insulinase family protein, partial [Blastocatellia bacterium]|nr:insulinase family protein [Blastocatellia bacterium]
MSRGAKLLTFMIALISLTAINALAQSGRTRQPPPPPPTPKPAGKPNVPGTTVLGIPEGGKLIKQDPNGSTSRFLLRNGLTVIVRERHSSPLVSMNVTVKVGSVDEPDEISGMARLVRQMILRGTAKRPGGAVEREVAQFGGQLGSQISYDQTSFTVTAPTESYQPLVELMADLIQRPAFNPEDLKRAAQATIIESRREQDSVETGAIERLFATAFTANRLKRGSSVSESMLSAVTREQALAFYQNFYHPANT